MDLSSHWNRWWAASGAHGDRDGALAPLLAAWGEPHRHYHTVDHLAACLADLDRWRILARDPVAVELALWFHDAVYDPKAHDNEERSAAWAQRFCAQAGLACGDALAALIAVTRHGPAPAAGDAALVVDIDLAVLAADGAAYDAYAAAVRREYGFVPDAEFRSGRAAVLRGFLERPAIYTTSAIHDLRERRARANLRRELLVGGRQQA
jgi:predicted metal-dependent HD superfamily phosphohydrolase